MVDATYVSSFMITARVSHRAEAHAQNNFNLGKIFARKKAEQGLGSVHTMHEIKNSVL